MLKVGIIGLGVGESHMKGYEEHPEAKVIALCDLDGAKLSEVGSKNPEKKLTENPDDILGNDQIDIVTIAGYDDSHYDQVMKALENGKHVFVEKPICLYENEAEDIWKKLKESKLKLSSNLILRMSPRFQKIRQMVKDSEFGEINYLEGSYDYGRLWKLTEGWRGKLNFYSVTYGGGVHIIDLLMWIGETHVEEVFAYGNNIASKGTQFKYNDLTMAALKFENGATGKMTCNFSCVMPHFHEINVFGTKGTFFNRPGDGLFYRSRDPETAPEKIKESYRENHKSDLIASFVDSILGNGEAVVSEKDVFDSMAVCFAIEKSMNSGLPEKVKYFEE
jgi:predicted dehydrogenase